MRRYKKRRGRAVGARNNGKHDIDFYYRNIRENRKFEKSSIREVLKRDTKVMQYDDIMEC